MGLAIKVETRTGDTPASRRRASVMRRPTFFFTTPEQLALLLAHARADRLFRRSQTVVLDELHALYNSKRGDFWLGLARICRGWRRPIAGSGSRHGADAKPLQRFLMPQVVARIRFPLWCGARPGRCRKSPSAFRILCALAGHLARHAMGDVLAAIGAPNHAGLRQYPSQAERTFQELWRLNEQNWAIALHHGSLSPEQRRKVEAAIGRGGLKAVVCTSTLDLGIDWGAVTR